MDVWSLSVGMDAAVFRVLLYGNILAISALIRPNRPRTKDFYYSWWQLAGSLAPAATMCIFVARFSLERLIATEV